MKIDRIIRIKKHRVFHDFSWPSNLSNFAQFNVIYGWNGVGKTTLSNLFRCIERREDLQEGEVEFLIGGQTESGKTFSKSNNLPRIRVFNRNYIDQNVFVTRQAITPIYYLGEDSVEKQKKIEQLKPNFDNLKQHITKKEGLKRNEESGLDLFCTQQAKSIKELLSSSPSNNYNTYNKSNFRQLAESLLKSQSTSRLISENEKAILKQQKESKPKPTIGLVALSKPDLFSLTKLTEAAIATEVASNVITELATNAQVAGWVQLGLQIHTGKHARRTCQFCLQTIPEHRLQQLEAHFNDKYKELLDELDFVEREIRNQREAVQSTAYFPVKEQFYDHLAVQFPEAMQSINDQIATQVAYLNALLEAIQKKRSSPFTALQLNAFLADTPLPKENDFEKSFERLDELISAHNAQTADFQNIASIARQKLEHCLTLESLEDFKAKTECIASLSDELRALSDESDRIAQEIEELQKDILGHLRKR